MAIKIKGALFPNNGNRAPLIFYSNSLRNRGERIQSVSATTFCAHT